MVPAPMTATWLKPFFIMTRLADLLFPVMGVAAFKAEIF
jgi:hypothetical protein